MASPGGAPPGQTERTSTIGRGSSSSTSVVEAGAQPGRAILDRREPLDAQAGREARPSAFISGCAERC
jgi:hypothetical protein